MKRYLIIGALLVSLSAYANAAAPQLITLNKNYRSYIERMSPLTIVNFFFDDPSSGDASSKQDKGFGGRFDYMQAESSENGLNYEYKTVVCFEPNQTIVHVAYFCMKGARGRYLSPDEVDYMLAVGSGGRTFKEVPQSHGNNHCVGGMWKLYRSLDKRIEATVGYTLEAGKLEAFAVELRVVNTRVGGCGGWIN